MVASVESFDKVSRGGSLQRLRYRHTSVEGF